MKHLVLSALVTLCSTVLAETNYCHDPETKESWEAIKRRHRGERDVETLYLLRARLCKDVGAGVMSVREATERFEAERERMIKKRQEHNRRQETERVGVG